MAMVMWVRDGGWFILNPLMIALGDAFWQFISMD
jgi:hypothetical protein